MINHDYQIPVERGLKLHPTLFPYHNNSGLLYAMVGLISSHYVFLGKVDIQQDTNEVLYLWRTNTHRSVPPSYVLISLFIMKPFSPLLWEYLSSLST